jgi:hypothetical protein
MEYKKVNEQFENQLENFNEKLNKNSLKTLPIKEVQDIVTQSDNYSHIIDQRGVCNGLSLLWGFNQRQQERKKQGSAIDKQVSDADKLLSTMDQIIKWSKTPDASNIIWHDENHNKTNNNKSKSIKSQDIEMLISHINSIQKSPLDLFGQQDAKQLKDNIINNNDNINHSPDITRQHNLAFLETIEKKDGKDIIKRPELILDTAQIDFKLVDQATIASYIKEIVKPGLIQTLSGCSKTEGHATSVYMKKDGSMNYYDPNAGEFALKKNDFEGLAKLYMQQMSSAGLTEKVNQTDRVKFFSEVYSLNQGEELEKDREIVTKFKDIVAKKVDEEYVKNFTEKATPIFSSNDFLNNSGNTQENLKSQLGEMLMNNCLVELEFTHNSQQNKIHIQRYGNEQYYYTVNNKRGDAPESLDTISQDLIEKFSNNSLPKITTKIYSLNQEEALQKDADKAKEIKLKLHLSKLKESVQANLGRIDTNKSIKGQEKLKALEDSIADIDGCIKGNDRKTLNSAIAKLAQNAKMKTGLFGSTTYKSIKKDIKNVKDMSH